MSDAHEDDDWNITYEHVNPDDPMIAGPRWREENVKLRAENQRLREALERIKRETASRDIRWIAHEALAGDTE